MIAEVIGLMNQTQDLMHGIKTMLVRHRLRKLTTKYMEA